MEWKRLIRGSILADIHSVAVLGSSLLEDLAEVETLRQLLAAEPLVGDGKLGAFGWFDDVEVILCGYPDFKWTKTSSFDEFQIKAASNASYCALADTYSLGPNLLRAYEGAVLFSGIGFSCDDKEVAIQDFDSSIRAGQQVAIVGETDMGKTALLRLLMRFHDVQAGKIIIDGYALAFLPYVVHVDLRSFMVSCHLFLIYADVTDCSRQDIRDVTLSSLRDAVGIIPQKPTLFDDTILENVRLTKPTATEQDVFDACIKAEVHDRILSFADGYSTMVGDGGVTLTDYERQQIAIAQIALKNPSIILIEEEIADSVNFDPENDSLIRRALGRLTAGRTTFVAAQRYSQIVLLILFWGLFITDLIPGDQPSRTLTWSLS